MSKKQRIYLPFKRLIGIFGSLIGIIVCFVFLWWWVIPVNAIATKGHPFFVRHRIGKNGKPFRLLKFRSMRLDADPHMTSRDEGVANEITRFGKFLRKSSIDETLQLFNILIGQMAFIGPRPLIDVNEDVITINKRKENGAIKLRPGISGWAQIHGREIVDPIVKGEMDGYYYRKMSFFVDVNIFILTLLSLVGFRTRMQNSHENA